METPRNFLETPRNFLKATDGDIVTETDHILTKEEVFDVKKDRLKSIFGEEKYEQMMGEAKSFFKSRRRSIVDKDKPIKVTNG